MAPPSTPGKYPAEKAYTSPLVTIEVGSGDTNRVFQIRKDVLRFYSGYFSAALNGRFTGAEEGVCRLPEEDPIMFEMFQHWMHDGTLYESTLEPALLMSYLQIARLYIFADAHDVPALQNKAIDIFARKRSFTKEPFTQDLGFYVQENTLESSPLRTLVLEMLRCFIAPHVTSKELVFDHIVRTLPRAVPDATSHVQKHATAAPNTWVCRFHVHGDGASCRKS